MSVGTGCRGDAGVGHDTVTFEQKSGGDREVALWISG